MQNYYSNTLINTKYYDPAKHYYHFITPTCKTNRPNFENEPIIFYQIAGFKNFKTNRYDARRVYITSKDNIEKFDDLYITKEQFDNLKRNVPNNRIKPYPVDNLYYIDMPRSSDIQLARSCLLMN